MAREGRVAELRRLVADGQYRVDSGRLAIKILARALRDRAS
jgi:anti-sigma28 factor (negative regulator of flagellin synthesis)